MIVKLVNMIIQINSTNEEMYHFLNVKLIAKLQGVTHLNIDNFLLNAGNYKCPELKLHIKMKQYNFHL